MSPKLPIEIAPWIQRCQTQTSHTLLGDDGDWQILLRVGPESRNDYHQSDVDEWYYQISGDLTLRIFENQQSRDVVIGAGEALQVPAGLAHAAQRPADSMGLLLEKKRTVDDLDTLFFVCPKCHSELYREVFRLKEPEADFIPIVKRFYGLETNCTCIMCGWVPERWGK